MAPLVLSLAEPSDFAGNSVIATVIDALGHLSASSASGAVVTSSNGGLTLSIVGSSKQVGAALTTLTDTYAYSPVPAAIPTTSTAPQTDTVSVSVADGSGHSATASISVTASPPGTTSTAAISPLFSAILAMDSYNRGYLSTVTLPSVQGTQIGDAYIYKTSADELTGFYAASYSVGIPTPASNTPIVISSRGTQLLSTYNSLADIFLGWFAGAGVLTPQVAEAIRFYSSVTGQSMTNGVAPNVLLTGHSLGGGLAGIIATLTGDKADIFDSMPYGAAAMPTFMAYDATALAANGAASIANWLLLLAGNGGGAQRLYTVSSISKCCSHNI